MPVTSNAATNELSSPFYTENEKTCHDFDAFIVGLKGETRGKYNAFSYNVLGKIPHANKWQFNIMKSSFTSGNLILSSKYQCLHVAAIWTAKNLIGDSPYFRIRPKKNFDFLLLGFFKKYNWLDAKKRYVVIGTNQSSQLKDKLIELLSTKIHLEQVWDIEYNNPELKIELRSESTDTELIERLIATDLS